MKKNIQLVFTILIIICIFLYRNEVIVNIREATVLFQQTIFPSLFPFMTISPFLINYGFLDFTNKIMGPIMHLFNLSTNCSYVLIMSLLSGFPGSAIYAKELYKQNLINKNEVNQLILFSHFSNPIFILTIVQTKPLLVLSIHYLLGIFLGIILRTKTKSNSNNYRPQIKTQSFFQIFACAIKNSMENILFILGVIVFFFMISSIANNELCNLFLELSQGLNYINNSIVNEQLKCSLAGALLSFGGFSIHLQTYGILSEMDFAYIKYLIIRCIHAGLTFVFIYFLYQIF